MTRTTHRRFAGPLLAAAAALLCAPATSSAQNIGGGSAFIPGGYLALDAYERPRGAWLDWPLVYLRMPDRADVPYGDAPRQKLDIWEAEPAPGQSGPRPVVVHFHHGGFGWGDKSMVPGFMVERFNRLGITVVSANYRFVFNHDWPAPLEDGVRVVQWLRHNAGELGIDPDRVGVLGTSAGAIMSMWIGLHDDFADPDAADPVERRSSRVSIVGSFEGQPTFDLDVYNRINGRPLFTDVGFIARAIGVPEAADDGEARERLLEHYSSDSHVDPSDPPVLLFYVLSELPFARATGLFWTIHHPALSDRLVERLDAAGVPWTRQVLGEPRESSDGFDDRGEVFEMFARALGVDHAAIDAGLQRRAGGDRARGVGTDR